ncbi:MAG: PAS domain-containing protein [Desulfovibrionaceae bacterium]
MSFDVDQYLRELLERSALLEQADDMQRAHELGREIRQALGRLGAALPSERRALGRMAEMVSDGLFRLRLQDGIFEYVNAAMEVITGRTRNELATTPFVLQEIIEPEWREFLQGVLDELAQGRNQGEYEFRLNGGPDKKSHVLVRTALVCDGDRVTHVEGVARDVTFQRQAEAQLARQRFMTNSVEDPMSLIGRDYRYKAVNRAFAGSVRSLYADPVGRHVSEVWGEKVFSGIVKNALDRCFSGEDVVYEAWFAFPGGSDGFYEVSYHPFREDEAGVTHAVVVSRNLTSLRLADVARTGGAPSAKGGFGEKSEMCFSLGLDHCLNYVSLFSERVLGFLAEDMLGRPIHEFVHVEDRAAILHCLAEANAAGEATAQCRVLTAAGAPVWVRVSLRSIVKAGRCTGLAGRLAGVRADESDSGSETL